MYMYMYERQFGDCKIHLNKVEWTNAKLYDVFTVCLTPPNLQFLSTGRLYFSSAVGSLSTQTPSTHLVLICMVQPDGMWPHTFKNELLAH